MSVRERSQHPLPTHLVPRFVVGAGLVALFALLSLLATDTGVVLANTAARSGSGTDWVLQGLLIGIPAVGLIYVGYWLHTGWFTDDQLWQIGVAAGGTTVVAAMCTALLIAAFPVEWLTLRETFSLFVSTGSVGAFVGVLVGVFSVTDVRRKRGEDLETKSDRFRYVERVAEIGYWELDATADPPFPLEVSDGWYRLHGLPQGEDVDVETGLDFYHPEDRSRIERAVERAITEGESYDLEVRLDTDEPCRWIHIVGEPVTGDSDEPVIGDGDEPVIGDDEVVKVRGTMQDITERKQYEQEIERQNERLDRFASVISHDLRNPLNVARGHLELARAESDSDHLDPIERAHTRMEALIEDLLTLARGENAATELEVIALGDVVEECRQTIATPEATLVVETDERIRADPSRLQQLLENLIGNSVEHAGPKVTVRIGTLPDGFYVADDGPGIPESECEAVFETGYSLSGDGTGLGLSIVREVAEDHGWDVEACASESGGARFEITGVECVGRVERVENE